MHLVDDPCCEFVWQENDFAFFFILLSDFLLELTLFDFDLEPGASSAEIGWYLLFEAVSQSLQIGNFS